VLKQQAANTRLKCFSREQNIKIILNDLKCELIHIRNVWFGTGSSNTLTVTIFVEQEIHFTILVAQNASKQLLQNNSCPQQFVATTPDMKLRLIRNSATINVATGNGNINNHIAQHLLLT